AGNKLWYQTELLHRLFPGLAVCDETRLQLKRAHGGLCVRAEDPVDFPRIYAVCPQRALECFHFRAVHRRPRKPAAGAGAGGIRVARGGFALASRPERDSYIQPKPRASVAYKLPASAI